MFCASGGGSSGGGTSSGSGVDNYEPPPYTEPPAASYVYEPSTPSYGDPVTDYGYSQDTASDVVTSGYGQADATGSVWDTFIDAAATVATAVIDAILPVQSASASSEIQSAEFGGGEPPSTGNPTDVYLPVITNNSPTDSQVFLPNVMSETGTTNVQNDTVTSGSSVIDNFRIGGVDISYDASTFGGQIVKSVDDSLKASAPTTIAIQLGSVGVSGAVPLIGPVGPVGSLSANVSVAFNWRSGELGLFANGSASAGGGAGGQLGGGLGVLNGSWLGFGASTLDAFTGQSEVTTIIGAIAEGERLAGDISYAKSMELLGDGSYRPLIDPLTDRTVTTLGTSLDYLGLGAGANGGIVYSPPSSYGNSMNDTVLIGTCTIFEGCIRKR